MRLKLHDKLDAQLNQGSLDATDNVARKLSLRAYHGDQESLKILIHAVEVSTDATVIRCAIRGIGLLGKQAQPALPFLLRHLNSSEREIRLEAIEALRKTGSESAVPALKAMLDDPDDYIHSEALRGLAEITGNGNYLDHERPNPQHKTITRRAAWDDPIYRGATTTIHVGGFLNDRIADRKKRDPKGDI